MDNPASDGSSLNCYSASAGSVDVHYSSGIGNHFYYLLAEGSGAKTINGVAHSSPTCNGSTVTGIGRAAAEKIWYRALTVYMTSSTNYTGARTATLNAARDLYGAGSTPTTRSPRMERGRRVLTAVPPRRSGSPDGEPVLGTRAPRPLLAHRLHDSARPGPISGAPDEPVDFLSRTRGAAARR